MQLSFILVSVGKHMHTPRAQVKQADGLDARTAHLHLDINKALSMTSIQKASQKLLP